MSFSGHLVAGGQVFLERLLVVRRLLGNRRVPLVFPSSPRIFRWFLSREEQIFGRLNRR